MFAKLLIANRGEIVCRIIRTARRLGIRTVAVYSEADARARHVRAADEAILIGAAPAAQSYLALPLIVAAAQACGADAVHPGYGFLSENAAFAEALDRAGIAFVGPGAQAIATMGDKIAAKTLAQRVGVNSIPAHLEPLRDADHAAAVAAAVGYPVMIKAAAGGGGKGMRVAFSAAEAREGFARAQSEAGASFGDDRVFIERFIAEPRHVEIQVLADSHGNTIHLGERECSIQRRHQKVIEEAPSPMVDDAMRAAMGAQAVALAQAVSYRSAGTVEFIVDRDRQFYFLEMNTRLQVEHPVTELVTGLDLVEQMLRIAAGERLALRQDEVVLRGAAIEARIYAEDPARGFLPSTGRLRRFVPPPESDAIRLDSGVAEGDEISVYYDPMIAKLCAHGSTRASAIAALETALDRFIIRGPEHNIGFLRAILSRPRFRAGLLSTNFIAEEFPHGFRADAGDATLRDRLIAVAAVLAQREAARATGQPLLGQPCDWVATVAGTDVALTAVHGPAEVRVRIGAREHVIATAWECGQRLFEGTVDGAPIVVQIDPSAAGYRLRHGGAALTIAVRHPRVAALAALMLSKPPPDTSKYLLSPMPGLVLAISVVEGEAVAIGQPLAIVDAMKMENVLRAERDGRVKRVHVAPGQSLAVDEIILEFE